PTLFRSILVDATSPTELYTLSLHDALPIWPASRSCLGTFVASHVTEHASGCAQPVYSRRGKILTRQRHEIVIPPRPIDMQVAAQKSLFTETISHEYFARGRILRHIRGGNPMQPHATESMINT